MTEGLHQHPGLAAGRWNHFSLAEQLANVGSVNPPHPALSPDGGEGFGARPIRMDSP